MFKFSEAMLLWRFWSRVRHSYSTCELSSSVSIELCGADVSNFGNCRNPSAADALWGRRESLEPSQDCFNKGIMAVKSSDVDSNFTLNGQMIPWLNNNRVLSVQFLEACTFFSSLPPSLVPAEKKVARGSFRNECQARHQARPWRW